MEPMSEIMNLAGRPLMEPSLYEEAIGHTEYQIRNFILSRKEFPLPDMRHKQAVLELWSRWGAANEAKYRADSMEQDIVILLAEIDRLRHTLAILPWTRKKRSANISKLEIEVEYKRISLKLLRYDLEHRIVREARVFAECLKENAPSDKGRLEAEAENWAEKARYDKKLDSIIRGNGKG